MNLSLLPGIYSIYKFKAGSSLPEWIYSSGFYSITKTKDEISVVAVQRSSVSEAVNCSKDWRILKIEGPLDLSLIGIIAGICAILKDKKIPVFIISTYNTDYIMIIQDDLNKGIEALKEKEYNVSV